MLAVLEAAASEEHGQVPDGMAAAVAEVAAEEDRRAIEQAAAILLRLLELREQVAHGLHRLHLHDFELLEFTRVLAVMRQIVMAERHAWDRRRVGGTREHDGDEPGGIGLER